MKISVPLLIASLAANAGLFVVLARRDSGSSSAASVHSDRVPDTIASARAPADSALGDPAALAPAELRVRLRALGISDAASEEIVRTRIFSPYENRRRELLDPALRSAAWWRRANSRFDPLSLLTPSERQELRDLEAAARDQVLAVLGPGALDRDGLIAARYAFTSPEKAVLLDALERDYRNLDAQLREETRNIRTAGDREQARLLSTERARDLASLLTPAEREALDLRASPTAAKALSRMAAFQPTEEEYRLVFAAYQAAEQAPAGPATSGTRLEERPDFLQQLRAALGEQRYAEWQFAGYGFVQSLATSATDLGLSGATVRAVGTIVYDTSVASNRLWNDPALTPAQKIEAMAKLVADNRAQIATYLGPDATAGYLKTVAWFDGIALGQAVKLNGTSGFQIFTPPGAAMRPATAGPGRMEAIPGPTLTPRH